MDNRKRLGVILIVGALLLALSVPVQSMGVSFTIYGQVFDIDGTTPADGVTVIATNLVTGSSVDPTVTAGGGWYAVNLGNLKPNEAHSAGQNIQIAASIGLCKNITTVIVRAATSPQLVNLVLQGESSLPTITNRLPANGTCVTDSTPVICANYSDAVGIDNASVRIEVDGANVTGSATVTGGGVCYTPGANLSDGVHTVRVNVSDVCGNKNTTSWIFMVDTIPPIILFNEPPTPTNNSEITVRSVNISANVTDSGCGVNTATVALIWNGTAYPMLVSGSTYYLAMHNLSNRAYSYQVQANDTGGNTRLSGLRVVTVNVTQYSVTLDLLTGYNLISLPVNDPTITTASTLANKIGANCTEVVKWDSALQQLVSYVIYAPLNNFALLPGVGYFVNVLGPTMSAFTGDGWTSPFNSSLVVGYNFIGIPVNDTSVTNAASLAAKIGGSCTELVRWDSASQAYVSYIPGVPLNNFPVRRGEGYLANMNNSANVTFAGAPWHN
jgi:hypothetical protein